MRFSRAQMAFLNGNGIPLVNVTVHQNRYRYSNSLTGNVLATGPISDEGIRQFAAKFWYIPAIAFTED